MEVLASLNQLEDIPLLLIVGPLQNPVLSVTIVLLINLLTFKTSSRRAQTSIH